jgi:hypothetical protein
MSNCQNTTRTSTVIIPIINHIICVTKVRKTPPSSVFSHFPNIALFGSNINRRKRDGGPECLYIVYHPMHKTAKYVCFHACGLR